MPFLVNCIPPCVCVCVCVCITVLLCADLLFGGYLCH